MQTPKIKRWRVSDRKGNCSVEWRRSTTSRQIRDIFSFFFFSLFLFAPWLGRVRNPGEGGRRPTIFTMSSLRFLISRREWKGKNARKRQKEFEELKEWAGGYFHFLFLWRETRRERQGGSKCFSSISSKNFLIFSFSRNWEISRCLIAIYKCNYPPSYSSFKKCLKFFFLPISRQVIQISHYHTWYVVSR